MNMGWVGRYYHIHIHIEDAHTINNENIHVRSLYTRPQPSFVIVVIVAKREE